MYLAHDTVTVSEDVIVALDDRRNGVNDNDEAGDDVKEESLLDYEDEGHNKLIE